MKLRHAYFLLWGNGPHWVIIILIIISNISCSSQENEDFHYQYDILPALFSHIPEETQLIEFGKAPHYAQYLLQGWSLFEEGHRWANATTATVYFYHHAIGKNKKIDITWASLPSSTKKKQRTGIILNDTHIKSLTVKPSIKTQSIRLPASALRPGFNLLTFQFSYTEKPARLDPNSQDERELAVAFQNILFANESTGGSPVVHEAEHQGFLQKANSGVGVFKKLPAAFELDIEYQSSKGMKASLEIIDEQGKKYRLSLPSGKNHVTRTFTLPREGIYKIHAACTGAKDGYIVWEKVLLNTQKPQEILENNSLNFVKRPGAARTQPDMLLYVIDTLRADHVGCYGYSRDTTPYIDAFAKENARYHNAYATSSWTKPSGASILTGLLPRNHHTNIRNAKLPDEVMTLAEILHKHGYYTVAFMTNGAMADYFGFNQGFSEFISFPEDHDSRAVHVRSDVVNTRVFEFLQEYVKTPDRKPLFMMIWSTDPHDPYTPPEHARKLFDIHQYTPLDIDLKLLTTIRHQGFEPTASQIEFMKARYDQEIFANDDSFGSLLDRLNSLGLYQEMTIVLTADHGEEFFEHKGVGHGLTLYNEQLRVPLIIKTPQIAPGAYDEIVQITDIYPTILDCLDIDEPYPLDGISLLNTGNHHNALYFEQNLAGNDLFARLDTTKKVIFNKQYFRPPTNPIIPVFESYTVEDIHEQKNLAIHGFEDYFRLQQLVAYIMNKSILGFQRVEADISPELDQQLRDLGYIK